MHRLGAEEARRMDASRAIGRMKPPHPAHGQLGVFFLRRLEAVDDRTAIVTRTIDDEQAGIFVRVGQRASVREEED